MKSSNRFYKKYPAFVFVLVLSLFFLMLNTNLASAEIIPGSEVRLTASDGVAEDFFGNAVSVDGDTMVIGAYHILGGDQGAAYVFVRSGSDWVQQAKLVAPDGEAGNQFGHSVSISGETIAVGAPGTKGFNGAAYIFERINGTWLQQSKLVNPSQAPDEYYGYHVKIEDATLIVTAPYGFSQKGGVYIYEYTGSSWNEQANLFASNGTRGDWFGGNVALREHTLAVSAENTDNSRGSVYIFTRAGNIWEEQAILTPLEEFSGDAAFGTSISLDGDTLLVGASFYDYNNNINSGAAFVFVQSGSTWTQQARLVSTTGTKNEFFGSSVSLLGDSAFIGVMGFSSFTGSVIIFERNGSSWKQTGELVASDAQTNANFGESLCFAGDEIVIGSKGWKGYQGAVYIYGYVPPVPTTVPAPTTIATTIIPTLPAAPTTSTTVTTTSPATTSATFSPTTTVSHPTTNTSQPTTATTTSIITTTSSNTISSGDVENSSGKQSSAWMIVIAITAIVLTAGLFILVLIRRS